MRATAGDREFDAFVAARSPALLRTAYLVTGKEAAAVDLLRAALADTARRWRRLDGAESAEPYVRRVLLTTRAASRSSAAGALPLRPAGSDPRDRVWAALAELTPRERVVLVLGVHDNLDDDEVARLIGSSRRAVSSDRVRAFATVRSILDSAEPEPTEPEPTEPEPTEPKPTTRPRNPLTAVDVGDLVRQSLAGRADDVRPPAGFIDDVHELVDELARTRRRQVAVGSTIAAGLVAGVVVVTSLTGATPPAASPTDPSGPSSAAPVPDSVLRLARENQALVAFGSTIVDAADGEPVVGLVAGPAGSSIQALAKAKDGYVVSAQPLGATSKQVPQLTLSYVSPDGAQVELGRMSDEQSGFAVSPDGSAVAHVITGPIDGENALAAGKSELVVQTLAGDVVNRVTVDGPVWPLAVNGERVWFTRLVDPGGPPYAWLRGSGKVTQLDLPPSETAIAVSGDTVVVRDESGSTCLVAFDTSAVSDPRALWRRCSGFTTAVIDAAGSQVAAIREAEGKAELFVLDARTGLREYSTALGADRLKQVAWTGSGRVLVTAEADGVVRQDAGYRYRSVQTRQSPGGVVPSTAQYRVPEGLVILGVETLSLQLVAG